MAINSKRNEAIRKQVRGRLNNPAALARRAFIMDGRADSPSCASPSPSTTTPCTTPRAAATNYLLTGEPGLGDFQNPPSRPVGPLYRQSPKVAHVNRKGHHFSLDILVLVRAAGGPDTGDKTQTAAANSGRVCKFAQPKHCWPGGISDETGSGDCGCRLNMLPFSFVCMRRGNFPGTGFNLTGFKSVIACCYFCCQ